MVREFLTDFNYLTLSLNRYYFIVYDVSVCIGFSFVPCNNAAGRRDDCRGIRGLHDSAMFRRVLLHACDGDHIQ